MDDFLKLIIVLIIFVLIALVGVLMYITYKDKLKKTAPEGKDTKDEIDEKKAQRSIFKFMEFDTVEDNMIVEDNGKIYLMVIECKGVNYDLMSNIEKNSIEQGFLSFLNALKFEIQLYIQTRKVNLMQSTARYRERLKAIELDMRQEEQKYVDIQRSPTATREEINREFKEVTKKRNLYEYARDVIENTEQMSADSDLTTKEYYIVVPYYTEEITSVGDYDKREISSMAFSELYTRAQSLVSTLSECDVRGRILNSQELVELLFISYNREQHDLYDFDEYMNSAGFDTFYSKTQDVLEKRMEALDDEIEKKGNEKAVEAYRRANKKRSQLQKAIEERERRLKEYINAYANELIQSQAGEIGSNLVRESKEELRLMDEEQEERRRIANARRNNINIEENNSTKDDEPKAKRALTEEEKELRRAKKARIEAKKNEKVNSILSDAKKTKAVKSSNLTEEEKRIRRAKMLKKKKMLEEMEAKKNGQKQDN